jgi:hypothetical protein
MDAFALWHAIVNALVAGLKLAELSASDLAPLQSRKTPLGPRYALRKVIDK